MIGIMLRYIASFGGFFSNSSDSKGEKNSLSRSRDLSCLQLASDKNSNLAASKERDSTNRDDLEQLAATGQAIAQSPSLWLSLVRDR